MEMTPRGKIVFVCMWLLGGTIIYILARALWDSINF